MKQFTPGDSVIIILPENINLIGTVSTDQVFIDDKQFVIVDVALNDEDIKTFEVPISYVHLACYKCYGKGVIDVGFNIECPLCKGSGKN